MQVGIDKFNEVKYLPKKITSEMKRFIKRNSLVIVGYCLNERMPLHNCCLQCLKSYLIKEARKFVFEEEVEKSLNKIFECEIGHDGYYLDRNRLFRVIHNSAG